MDKNYPDTGISTAESVAAANDLWPDAVSDDAFAQTALRVVAGLFNVPAAVMQLTGSKPVWHEHCMTGQAFGARFLRTALAGFAPRPTAGEPPVFVNDSAGIWQAPQGVLPDDARCIRFCACIPLTAGDGAVSGFLWLLDTRIRVDLEQRVDTLLADTATMIVARLEAIGAFRYRDRLTHLGNRTQFVRDLRACVQAHTAKSGAIYAVVIDIGSLSMVSRMVVALGLSAVEHSIQSMTATLMAAKPAHIRLYRLGHARFGFVHLGDIEPARALALRFTSCFDQPLDIGNAFPIALSAHAGIARIDDDDAAADVMGALFAVSEQARAANRTLLMYDKAIQAAQQRAFAIGNSMRAALAAEDQLRLVYQPRERLSDGAWVAAEALIRWHHPQLGELAPGEFVPLIETTSLMPKLTDWVIEHAVAQLAAWNRSAPWFRISINIAASDFGRADLVDMLCAALARHRADASNLEIEITETAIAADPEHAHAMLRKLREIGIVVAIDDFGSGYSSLARWQTFSFDILKIDRTLIRDAIENERANAVFQWVASLAKKLGQRVVVEGIENAAQRNAAAHWGCDEAQGFLISHPLEAASMTARLAARRNRSIDDLPIERSARAMRREWTGTRQIHGSVSPDSITARLMNLRRTISAYLRPR